MKKQINPQLEALLLKRRIALGQNLVEIRNLRALTQDQLAEISGVPQTTISAIENWHAEAKNISLVMLAAALGVSLCALVPPYEDAEPIPMGEGGGEKLTALRKRLAFPTNKTPNKTSCYN